MPSQFTQTFDSEGGFPGLGSLTVEFRPGTQWILGPGVERTSVVAGGPYENHKKDTLVITRIRLGAPDRDQALAAAVFAARIHAFDLPVGEDEASFEPWRITGPQVVAWIGDGDSPGKGPGISWNGSASWTSTLGAYLAAFWTTNGHDNGLAWSSSGMSANNLNTPISAADAARDRLHKLLRLTTTATEYRCTHDGEILLAPRGGTYAYRQTPQVMLTSTGAPLRDGDLWSFQVAGRATIDYADEADSVYAYEEGSWSASAVLTDRVTKDLGGVDDAVVQALLSSSGDADGLGSGIPIEQQLYNTFRRKDRMRLSIVSGGCLADYMTPGDHVWVNAPEAGFYDLTENINFAGEETHPIKLRASSMTCPITDDMGAYIIHNATEYGGANSVQDVTDEVLFAADDDRATVEFDPAPPLRKIVRGLRYRKGHQG